VQALRAIYKYWAAVVFLAVLAQVAAAAYGGFYASDKLSDQSGSDEQKMISEKTFDHGFGFHTGFGYAILLGAILLFLLALGARLARTRIWWNLALPVLVAVQTVLAWISEDVPFIGIFHGLNALVIFGLSGSLAGRAWMEGRRAAAAPAAEA
jgi:Family of unknown function (DUF6220)